VGQGGGETPSCLRIFPSFSNENCEFNNVVGVIKNWQPSFKISGAMHKDFIIFFLNTQGFHGKCLIGCQYKEIVNDTFSRFSSELPVQVCFNKACYKIPGRSDEYKKRGFSR
jgi:hypothetical protein